jgi:hypothetical protein
MTNVIEGELVNPSEDPKPVSRVIKGIPSNLKPIASLINSNNETTPPPARTGRHVLIYGASKSGKTLAIGRIAKYKTVLLIDLENGSEVLDQLPPELRANIFVVKVFDTPKNTNAIKALVKFVDEKDVTVCHKHGHVDCVHCKFKGPEHNITINLKNFDPDEIVFAVDSVTQLSRSAMSHVFIKRNKETAATLENFTKPEWDDYNAQAQLLDYVFINIQNSPFDWVALTHEQNLAQEDEKEKLSPIGGTKNYARQLPAFFGHVVRLENRGGSHVGYSQTKDAKKFVVGSRSGLDLKKHELAELFNPDFIPSMQETSGISLSNEDTEDTSEDNNSSGTSAPKAKIPASLAHLLAKKK